MATRWSEDDKANALDQLRNGDTLATVHHDTGIPKQTLSRWAKTEGLDLAGLSQAKTMTAVKAHAAGAEERRAKLIAKLGRIADLASDLEVAILLDGDERPSLRDVVGARTRAIHDAELLAGRATSRTASVTALDEEIATLAEALAGNDTPAPETVDA
jgi:transposase-like protein